MTKSLIKPPKITPHPSQPSKNELFSLLVKRAPIITWSIDTDMRFTTSYGLGASVLNVESEEVIGISLYDFFSDQPNKSAIDAHLRALFGDASHYQYAYNDRIFDCYVEPLRDHKMNIVGAMGWAIDVTEQKMAEDALQKRIIALTQPVKTDAPPKFEDLFDVNDIQTIQDAFAEATGVASIITEVDGTPITKPSKFCHLCLDIIRQTEKGLANCMHSDAELGKKNPFGPILQPCLSGGLWDGGAGITAGEYHIANWLIGQVMDDSQDEEQMLKYGRSIGANMDEYKAALKTVTRMPREQFEKISNALFIIARQLSILALQNVQQARFISERQKAEEELAAERSLLRTLIYTLPDAVYVKDNQGRKTLSNQADYQAIGMSSEEEVKGKTDAEFYPPEIAAHIKADEKQVLEEGVPLLNHEELTYSADGTPRWVLTSKVPLHDRDGKITGLVGIEHDITEMKKANDEIERLNQELEQRVIERTADLESALHEIEAFSYSVSHDLRTPLRGINAYGQFLLEEYGTVLDEKGVNYIHRIRESSLRLSQLIEDVLRLSHLSRSEMKKTTVNLSKLAENIISDFQSAAPKRKVEVIITPDLIVRGDSNLLSIMLENLLSNSWKFTSKHATARIEVGQTKINDEITYFVRDDGAGFKMAHAAKLFSAFQRLHSPGEYEGSGIGLAFVQRIVHRHGGKVWAQSAPEQGATFYFTLP